MISKITEPKIEITESPIYYNKKWAIRENIVLRGRVIDSGGYSAILSLQNQIAQLYSAQTNTLSVGGFVRTNVFLQSINFGSSDYLSNSEYIVEFTSYPNNFFEEAGILDPVNEWRFEEAKGENLIVTHRVSARGINTSNLDGSLLTNAQNFVQNLVYPSMTSVPTTLSQFTNFPHANFILKNRSENSNRISGEYSIEETYELDLVNSQNAIIEYQIEVSESKRGFSEGSIRGSVRGGLNTSIAQTRSAFSSLNLKNLIESVSGLTLNPVPLSKTESENEESKSITFNYLFDDNLTNTDSDNVILALDLSQTKDESNITSYNLRGKVFGRLALKDKWDKIEIYYEKNLDIYRKSNVLNLFSQLDLEEVNTKYKSSSVTKNQFEGVIEFSILTNDKSEAPSGLDDFEYSINIDLPAYRATSFPLVGKKNINGIGASEYLIQKLGYYNRTQISISGNGLLSDETDIEEGKKIIEREVINISSEFLKGNSILTQKEINSNPSFGKEIQFNFSWEYDSDPVNFEDRLSEVRLNL